LFNNIDVLTFTAPQSNYKKDKRYHIHQKPIKLFEFLISISTEENDLILDSFI
jgi:DNA modification methylase